MQSRAAAVVDEQYADPKEMTVLATAALLLATCMYFSRAAWPCALFGPNYIGSVSKIYCRVLH